MQGRAEGKLSKRVKVRFIITRCQREMYRPAEMYRLQSDEKPISVFILSTLSDGTEIFPILPPYLVENSLSSWYSGR